MDSRRNGNLAKLVAFFLIVTVLVMAIAFSASGWQDDSQNADSNNEPEQLPDKPQTDGDQTTKDPEEPETQAYRHYISGLEITEAESILKPLCIVYDSIAPMYGISSSILTVELPVEGGKTRLLAFTNDATSLGKIGSILPTRGYISNVASYFGGVQVHLGYDDSFSYTRIESTDDFMDLSNKSGYYYTEYGMYSYTNKDLISAYIKNEGIGTVTGAPFSMPYEFRDENTESNNSGSIANTVLIQFDKGSTTELIYSKETDKYTIQKNSLKLSDKINDTTPTYDNVFVLYADAVTHETADATELILDTISGGRGHYINGGFSEEITWETTEDGTMRFLDGFGQPLKIDPGISYMAFTKSSLISGTKLG